MLLLLQSILNLLTLHLTSLQSLNKLIIIKQIPFTFIQKLQNQILSAILLLLIHEILFNILRSLLIFQRLFLLYYNIKHLIFQPFNSYLEVKQCHLHTDLRRIMRLRVLSSHIKHEILRVIDQFLTEFQLIGPAYFDQFFL